MRYPIKDETIRTIEAQGFEMTKYRKEAKYEEMTFLYAKFGAPIASLSVFRETGYDRFFFSNEIKIDGELFDYVTKDRLKPIAERIDLLLKLIDEAFPPIREALKAEGLEEAE